MNVKKEIIRNEIEGLVKLIVESYRNKMRDIDFREYVMKLGLSEEKKKILEVLYKGKKKEINDEMDRIKMDINN
jgi:uncharacterized protein YydD (DUF2326 family)